MFVFSEEKDKLIAYSSELKMFIPNARILVMYVIAISCRCDFNKEFNQKQLSSLTFSTISFSSEILALYKLILTYLLTSRLIGNFCSSTKHHHITQSKTKHKILVFFQYN